MAAITKMSVTAFALFIAATSFAQGRSGGHAHAANEARLMAREQHQIPHKVEGRTKREEARTNGAANATTRANENGQNNANENSVFNGTAAKKEKHKQHRKKPKTSD